MLALDINVLVRQLARDDPQQAAAVDRAIVKGGWISHLVLAEAVWVLDAVYARTPEQLIRALEMLVVHESLLVQDADVVAAALTQFRARPALGFSDSLVLETARKAGHLPLCGSRRPICGTGPSPTQPSCAASRRPSRTCPPPPPRCLRSSPWAGTT